MTEELLQCYNRGCGQKYVPSENNDGKLSFVTLLFSSIFKDF